MEKTIREQIFELADEQYKKFMMGLCPDNDNIAGVRLPLLRNVAKEIAKGDWRKYVKKAQSEYYEELMLEGLVLGYVKADVEELLGYISEFIPKINSWGICDSFCTGLKFTKRNKERVWEFIQPYLSSKEEFQMRFGVVMLLDYYIEEAYIDRVLRLLNEARHDGYYVQMAVAWAVSVCYVKFPKKTMEYLKNNTLEDFTYNKALQKIMESLRVDREEKELIRSMKRK
ncbi:MAG: DNA alkylation repair protein [Clostridiaceae bacterium]